MLKSRPCWTQINCQLRSFLSVDRILPSGRSCWLEWFGLLDPLKCAFYSETTTNNARNCESLYKFWIAFIKKKFKVTFELISLKPTRTTDTDSLRNRQFACWKDEISYSNKKRTYALLIVAGLSSLDEKRCLYDDESAARPTWLSPDWK